MKHKAIHSSVDTTVVPPFREHDNPDDFEVALWTSMAKDKRHQAATIARQVRWLAHVKCWFAVDHLSGYLKSENAMSADWHLNQ